MDYDAALALLGSLADYERSRPRRYDTQTYDLARFAALLARLGSPQDAYAVIHVAGTKGKGSTCAMVAAALAAAGARAGVFSSPHLRSVRERVVVDGEMIPPADFARLMGAVKDAMGGGAAGPNFRTYFEVVLAVALLHFREKKVSAAVLETGLGGRLDATNVVAPALTALTTLGLDHTDVLGETLAAVAAEKAAIMKAGAPAVSAPQPPAALAVVEETAARVGAALVVVGRDVAFKDNGDGTFDYRGARYELAGVRPAMAGPAQLVNGAVALAALELFAPVAVPAAAARAGVEAARLRARAEFIAGSPALLLDAAHNDDSARELAAVVRARPEKPRVLVWGMSDDKDAAAFARELAAEVDAAVATAAASPRALPPAALAAAANGILARMETAPTAAAALGRARALAGPDGLVVVAGSFYLAGEVLALLEGPVV